MSNELIINASLPETRIALMESGEIQELLIERASEKGIVGNIYKGRVTRVLPGMQAAFVDIGLEKAAFLYVDDVYVHSELWEEEEEVPKKAAQVIAEAQTESHPVEAQGPETRSISPVIAGPSEAAESELDSESEIENEGEGQDQDEGEEESDELNLDEHDDSDDDDHNDPDRDGIAKMDADPDGDSGEGSEGEGGEGGESSGEDQPEGTLAPGSEAGAAGAPGGPRKRHRRGRRGGRFRRKGTPENANQPQLSTGVPSAQPETYPDNYHEQVAETGHSASDRSGVEGMEPVSSEEGNEPEAGRPESQLQSSSAERRVVTPVTDRSDFRAPRSRDRRIRQKTSSRPVRAQVNIQDLLKEGQEVIVQVAKDPIATKGARLTCHISLPGRHLVCMPTIDHVGVSRRIEREEERRRLREFVEKNRPRNLGFIVRTASGKQQSEKRIKQDIDYLTRLWTEIREKAGTVTAPALVYEDLNSVLRAIRDWVNEDIDKVIVDSRYHYNEILRFVSHFMPSLKQKVELYHGDIPIFDAYGISTELSRALERKVWLKSGGYIVVDQAEALVAIDVNTGRYVGKKNLEDTILKTNLEAVQEIAYQLRLRNCGGIIILDLIDMEKDENKHRVYRALEEALQRDRARPSILKISELGLIEMTRKRTRDTIVRTLCESCTHCEGKGFIKGKLTVAYEAMREIEREGIERDVSKILVQAHPDVIDILAIDERETLDQLERRYRKLIYLQAVTDFHPEQFEVTADKRERVNEPNSEREGDRDREKERDRDRGRNRNADRHRGDRSQEQGRHDRNQSRSEGPTALVIPVVDAALIIRPVIPVPITSVSSHQSPTEMGAESAVPTLSVPGGAPAQDGSYDEEDRLAFLRAQAAQDAALARLSNGNAHPARPSNDAQNRSAPGGRGGAGRGGRGRRGGKFRRGAPGGGAASGGGADRGRDRGPSPRQFGANSGPKWNEGPKDSGGGASGGDSSGTPSGSGGGGDSSSQPPA